MSESEIMSQKEEDHINRLPPELLRTLFDYLKWEECTTASRVCSRWQEIQKRNPPKSLVRGGCYGSLKPQELTGGHLIPLGTCHSVSIDPGHFETAPEDRVKLEKYLGNRELMKNWKEIMFYGGMDYNFKGGELYLPNVEVISIRSSYSRSESRVDRIATPPCCRIVAPNLRTFYQANDAILEPLIQLNEQILNLNTEFREKSVLLSTVGNLPFTNLRSLGLEISRGGNCLQETDFTVQIRAKLGRLNRLKFNDQNRNFSPVFGVIFEEAKNLQELEIYEGEVNASDLRGINELKQLKELSLDRVTITGTGDRMVLLSLPNLTKLKISSIAGGVVQLGNVPCLTSLDLHVDDGIEQYLRPVAHQLQRLELFGGCLEDSCFQLLYALGNLSSLKMSYTRMQLLKLEELFQRLKNLRLAVFVCCTFMKTVMVLCNENDTCDCSLCNRDPWYGPRTFTQQPPDQYKDCIEMLRARHVDCTIAYYDGKMRVEFQRNSNREY